MSDFSLRFGFFVSDRERRGRVIEITGLLAALLINTKLALHGYDVCC
jgi:hypothetical protein